MFFFLKHSTNESILNQLPGDPAEISSDVDWIDFHFLYFLPNPSPKVSNRLSNKTWDDSSPVTPVFLPVGLSEVGHHGQSCVKSYEESSMLEPVHRETGAFIDS